MTWRATSFRHCPRGATAQDESLVLAVHVDGPAFNAEDESRVREFQLTVVVRSRNALVATMAPWRVR